MHHTIAHRSSLQVTSFHPRSRSIWNSSCIFKMPLELLREVISLLHHQPNCKDNIETERATSHKMFCSPVTLISNLPTCCQVGKGWPQMHMYMTMPHQNHFTSHKENIFLPMPVIHSCLSCLSPFWAFITTLLNGVVQTYSTWSIHHNYFSLSPFIAAYRIVKNYSTSGT